MQKPSIIVKDLKVCVKDIPVLDDISFSLQPHHHLAILGSCGSGKTSLAKALAGKINFSGEIYFDGSPTVFVAERYFFKNLSGITDFYYQQRFNSFDADDALTVGQELLGQFPATENHENKIQLINSGLKRLGILHLKDSPLIQLSSGEHKRFQLIKAILSSPALLILDSPFTGLDVESRKGLNELLNDLADRGTQIILVPGTFALPDCITHIARLDNTRLQFFGEKQHLNFSENDASENETSEAISFFIPELLSFSNENLQPETIIRMINVGIKYGHRSIIKNLNWEVAQGEKWLLKGPNGVGKSSLLNLVTGDHPQAYSNEIYLFDKRRGSGESIWDIKQKIGYVSPELHAFFDKGISCFAAIGSGFFDTMGLYKKLTAQQRYIILHWLDFLHLSHVQHKALHSISTSLQRLILLARALVKNPPLLILDEPCQGLDQKQRNLLISLIDHICWQSEKTLLFVSHEEDEIPACIDKVLHLEHGQQTIFTFNKFSAMAEAS